MSAEQAASTAAPAAEAPVAAAAQSDANEDGRKVFVGNLAFSTKKEDIQAEFAKAGSIEDVQIITRGTRSMGYGFVTYETAEAAQSAVSQLDKTELQGREINVEVAKPPSAQSVARRAAAAAAANAGTDGAPSAVDGEASKKKKSKRAPRKKAASRRPRADDETEEAGDAPLESTPGEAVNGSGDSTLAASTATGVADADAPLTGSTRGTRAGRGRGGAAREGGARRERKGPPQNGEPSKTLVYVSNLPFSVSDESLRDEVFAGCAVKSATVVKRKFGAAAGRSKGFAFVDLESEEEQQKAIATVNGKEVDGRSIGVKVAIIASDEDRQNQDAGEPDATIVAS